MKSGGNARPFGNLWRGSLNSSKNAWAHACNGDTLSDGVYSSKTDTNSTASAGVRIRKTFINDAFRLTHRILVSNAYFIKVKILSRKQSKLNK